jgi:hypothetical protein
VIQKYIKNPFIYHKKKIDMRAFAMVVSTEPFIVLLRKGFFRISVQDYDLSSKDEKVHITNTK